MFRATTGDFSSPAVPSRRRGVVRVPDGRRTEVVVTDPILTPALAGPGDSGGLLHELGRSPSAVGSYVGQLGDVSVFEAISGLVDRFPCPAGTYFRIWSVP